MIAPPSPPPLPPLPYSIVVHVADSKPKTRYILAVDDSGSTLEEVVTAISSSLGSGRIQHISKEDALLNKDLTVYHYDVMGGKSRCYIYYMPVLCFFVKNLHESTKTCKF